MRALKVAAGIVIAVVLIAGGVGVAGLFGYGDSPSGDGAIKACREDVETRLLSPRSAEYSDEKADSSGDDTWTVVGYVDAENEFGASIRKRYECTASSGDGKAWNVDATVAP